jgi:hypothetical protein
MIIVPGSLNPFASREIVVSLHNGFHENTPVFPYGRVLGFRI